MHDSRLSLVLFSALLSHGGGRETWLNNILPEILSLRAFDKIDVYFFSDSDTDSHPRLPICADLRVNFIEVRLPVLGGKWRSIWRIIVFCANVVRKLRRQLSSNHCVVAVGTFYEGAVVALLRMTMLHPPMLVTWIRGVWSKEIDHRHKGIISKLICLFEKEFMLCPDRIISNGSDTKIFYESLVGRHVEEIPNALDIKRYQYVSRRAFENKEKVIAYIGRLSEEKGLRAYLDAIALHCHVKGATTVWFDIVGDGPLKDLVKQFIATNSQLPVRYLGPIPNESMPSYLSGIDAGVCLTYSKKSGGGGVSNGLLELVGTGRLVIAWNSLIYKQVLDDTQALFVEESNIALLAESFSHVDADPEAMRARIMRSVNVLEQYTLEKHVRHFVDYISH